MPNKPKIASLSEAKKYHFNVGHEFGVDATTGNLTDLQLMAADREAKGHGIWIDAKTIATGAAAVAERGGRIKAYVTHNHDGPTSWGRSGMDEASSELNIPGFFSEIKVKKAQLVAGQFEFFDAFKANFKPQYDQLLEMAKKTPDLLGISVECWGYLVYVAKDGTEFGVRPEGVELKYDGMPALRITDMWAAAFVGDGAATDGLFAKFSSLFGGKRTKEERAAVKAALVEFAANYGEEENALPLSPNSDEPDSSSLTPTQISPMQIIKDLKAKFANDQKKFAAAMLLVGNNPEITIAALEAQLVQDEFAAARADVATLTTNLAAVTAERDTARTQLAAVTAERDTAKAQFEALKKSGLGAPQNLGAASAGAADAPNPYAKATKNLSAQAALEKSNPEIAAAMKAAAGAK